MIASGPSGCAPNTDGPGRAVLGTAGEESGGAGGAAPTDAGANGGSGGSGFAVTGHGLPGAEPGTWTYLLYMIADNPLEPFMVEDLSELMQVGSEGALTILAQIDRAPGTPTRPWAACPILPTPSGCASSQVASWSWKTWAR